MTLKYFNIDNAFADLFSGVCLHFKADKVDLYMKNIPIWIFQSHKIFYGYFAEQSQ